MRSKTLQKLIDETPQEIKDYVDKIAEEIVKDICVKKGHSMYKVFEKDNGYSVYGQHKCSRCGITEDFQYDYRINGL